MARDISLTALAAPRLTSRPAKDLPSTVDQVLPVVLSSAAAALLVPSPAARALVPAMARDISLTALAAPRLTSRPAKDLPSTVDQVLPVVLSSAAAALLVPDPAARVLVPAMACTVSAMALGRWPAPRPCPLLARLSAVTACSHLGSVPGTVLRTPVRAEATRGLAGARRPGLLSGW